MCFVRSDGARHDGSLDAVGVIVFFGGESGLIPSDAVTGFCPWSCNTKAEVDSQPYLCAIGSMYVEDFLWQVNLGFGARLNVRKLNRAR